MEISHRDRILEVLPLIGIQPKCLRYYHEAFTHRSFKIENDWPYQDNERLEFIGDSILQSTVSLFLMEQYFYAPQGDLTILRAMFVRTETLTAITMKYNLHKAFLMSKGEQPIAEKFCGLYKKAKPYKLRYEPYCGLFEALVAAHYYDCGSTCTTKWVRQLFSDVFQELEKEKYVKDPKTRLQELTRKLYGSEPKYTTRLTPESPKYGFFSKVFVNDKYLGCGYGKSKKESQKCAAQSVLQKGENLI
ncbi:MAG: ribonuclease III domain-containing protein [Caldisericia bacterium]|nr:ribonuclease III domain-containing protein [Caldisericia bacterium]